RSRAPSIACWPAPAGASEAMSPWDWTWEDPAGRRTVPSPTRPGGAQSPPPSVTPPDRETRFRRRRATAAAALVVVVVLLLAALHSRGAAHPHSIAAAKPSPVVAKLSPAESHGLVRAAEDRAIASVMAYTPVVVQ